MIYNQFDVVLVPFPFTDDDIQKRRPALVLSSHEHFNKDTGHSIMAMITSARNLKWPGDVEISDLSSAGLPKASIIRMKLFTIDHRLIIEPLGMLSPKDQKMFKKMARLIFGSF